MSVMQSFRFFLGLAAFIVSTIYFGAAGCQRGATSGRLGAVAANVGTVATSSSKTGGGGKGGGGGYGGGYGGAGANSNVGGVAGGANGVGGKGTGGTSVVVGGSGGAGGNMGGGVPVAMTKWSAAAMYAGEKRAEAIAVDTMGNIIMAGSAKGSFAFPPQSPVQNQGEWDAWLIKFDATGNCLWVKGFGDPADDFGYAIVTDSQNNIIVAGAFNEGIHLGGNPLTSGGQADAFVAKFAPNGTHIWSRRYGGSGNAWVTGLATNSTDDILLTGQFLDKIDFSVTVDYGIDQFSSNVGGGPPAPHILTATEQDIFVVKLLADGQHVWSKSFGNAGDQHGGEIEVDGSGNIWLAGDFSGTVSFGGQTLSTGFDLDIYLTKLTATGDHLYSKQFGTLDQQQIGGLAIDTMDNVVIVGEFVKDIFFGGMTHVAGASDAFVAKFATDGTFIWSKSFGDGVSQGAVDVTTDAADNVTLVGYNGGNINTGMGAISTAGDQDVFVLQLKANGDLNWAGGYGNSASDSGTVCTASGNEIVAAGRFVKDIDFGTGPLVPGDMDIQTFLVRFAAYP